MLEPPGATQQVLAPCSNDQNQGRDATAFLNQTFIDTRRLTLTNTLKSISESGPGQKILLRTGPRRLCNLDERKAGDERE